VGNDDVAEASGFALLRRDKDASATLLLLCQDGGGANAS